MGRMIISFHKRPNMDRISTDARPLRLCDQVALT